MKRNLPITQMERDYHPDERLISETDLRGIVTTANTSFCEVAGFSPEELVGKSHNLVRHPDMPPEAFADMWRTIQAGERWVGVVKNRCKNGDYYWVKAFVSPVMQDGQIVRYRSVRRKPSRAEVQEAEALYQRMRGGEQGLLNTLASMQRRIKLGERLGTAGQVALAAGFPLALAFGLLGAAGAGVRPVILWGAAGAGLAVTAYLAWLIYGWITQPLDELNRAFSAFAEGDLTARAAVDGRSRAAQLAKVTNRALDGVEVAIADMGQMLDGLARGEFGRRIVATLPGELERIKAGANRAAEQIETTVGALNRQLAALAEGRLDGRLQEASDTVHGQFREAQEKAAVATAQIAALLIELVGSSRAMATGDLTRTIELDAPGELATMRAHFNSALASLAETLSAVRENARHVAEATSEIGGAIEEVAAGATTQMETVDQVTRSLQESGSTIADIAESTEFASAKSRETVAAVTAGRATMQQMVSVVQSIAAASEQIGQITGVIEEIANRTNLLSLNAAIEAARAGEAGKGFAVVASEVGKLATNSGRSAKEIAARVEQAVAETRKAVESVETVAADMDRIERAARESDDLLNRIAAAMEEQRASLEAMGQHAVHLSMIAQSNAATTEELAASASELARIADGTHRAVDRFRIPIASHR